MVDTSRSFSSDFIGRINNISLAPSPSSSLAPVYEAVMNSVQAIEDRFGHDNLAKGNIDIFVLRDGGDDSRPKGFRIEDNGIGFTEANLDAFLTSDTRNKIKRGGKGVGRFLWLKVFNSVHVQSNYDDNKSSGSVSFDFVLEENDQIRNIVLEPIKGSLGTTILLDSYNPGYDATCPSKPTTIRNKLIGHFISYFVNMNGPTFVLHDVNGSTNLFDVFTDATEDDDEFEFELDFNDEQHEFTFNAFKLPKDFSDDEQGYNAVFYGAHGRSVERVDLDKLLGLKAFGNGNIFLGYVESELQDGFVNQERTHLNWSREISERVHKEVVEKTKSFLDAEIQNIRKMQASKVSKLRNEHLRFLSVVKDPEVYAQELSLGTQRPEDIYLEMSRTSFRQYNTKKNSFDNAKLKGLADSDEKAAEFASELHSESVSSLAEYVMKRKLILEVFEDRLKFKNIDDEKHYFEEAVHEIICPLRQTSDSLGYEDHNLWMVDDSLAFYTYFASDKTIKSTTAGAEKSREEPDIAIFDLGLSFEHEGSTDPITIIEFKRPGIDDYSLNKNPFVQVREYVTKLRSAGTAKGADGREVCVIEEKTPFHCFVVADITPKLRDAMKQFGPFYQKAGHGSYYKWDEGFSIFIEVISYAEILKGAKARNQAFFDRLGLNL